MSKDERIRELVEECDKWWRKWNCLRVEKCLRDGIEPYPRVSDVRREPCKYEGYL